MGYQVPREVQHAADPGRPSCETGAMSIFDQLRVARMVAPPAGFRACQRHPVPGATVDEVDALVEEAGGSVERRTIQSKGLRPGRGMASHTVASYYLLPESAFDG